MRVIAGLGLRPVLRTNDDGAPFVTDGGHFIADCASDGIADPAALAGSLKAITGVVDHGLFVGMAALAITIAPDGTITDHAPAGR
jgi:ribose 5-phosphate isomerase A